MATLGEQAVGSIVKLNVSGTAKDFIVVHQGLPGTMYDASCDGTWLFLDSQYVSRAFDSSNNSYADSDAHSYINSTFLNSLDTDIKDGVKTVKIPYTNGTGSSGKLATGSNGLSTQAFLLSLAEVGVTNASYGNVEGAPLAYFGDGTKRERGGVWWLRTPRSNTTSAYSVKSTGSVGSESISNARGFYPTMILPPQFEVGADGMVIPVSSGAITGQVNINGVMRELTGAGYININGVLRDLSDSQANIENVLKSLKG